MLLCGGQEDAMPTRGEQFRYEEQRKNNKGGAKRASKQSHKKGAEILTDTGYVGKKATYAYEPKPESGRPSRKSSRKSANRSKPDTQLNLREERAKTSPESRYRKARAKRSRVRGKQATAG
jgi:hypothetical protein